MAQLASQAAKEFSQYGVLYSGQDWLQDPKGNFYFLELNLNPGMEMFNTLYNGGEGDFESAIKIGTRKLAEALVNYKK